MSAKPLNVLISGSGIACGSFAFCLFRAYPDAKITIVERAPSLRLTGASVDIRSSAVDIIKWMGLEQAIRNASTHEAGMRFVREDGTGFATMYSTGRDDIQSFSSEYEIFRGELGKVILEPVLDQVELIYDEIVADYVESDDGVKVTFSKSKEVKNYDLLVAADGFGSRIRGKMMGCNPREHIVDEGVRAAFWTMKPDLLNGELFAKAINAPGGRCVIARPDPHPEGQTRALFVNAIPLKDKGRLAMFDKTIEQGNEAYMTLLESLYQDMGWLTPQLLKGMRQSDDFYCTLFGQVQCPRLHSKRVVLVGDAGFATPGIGTSLAIMGGYVLAGELLTHGEDIATALESYENLMLPFVKTQQGGVGAMQMMAPQTQWGITLRDTVVKAIFGLRLDWIAMHAAAKLGFTEKKLKMPEYAWPVTS